MQRYFAKNIEKEKVTLKESDIHHIKNVMRMNIHNKIEVVFNKKIYLCEILNNYQIKIIEEIISNEQNKKEIILASSLIKEQKQDLILQKTTELGVDTIIPLCLSRCVVKLDENNDTCLRISNGAQFSIPIGSTVLNNSSVMSEQSKTFEFESKKYRTLYIAAKNKLEINDIPFNEYALVQSLENEERSSIQAPPVAIFQ